MFVHIGNGKSVKKKDIIGIFDLDSATVTKTGKDFLGRKEREGLVEYEDLDLPRSFILCKENGNIRVRLSRISTQGLRLRAEQKDIIKEI